MFAVSAVQAAEEISGSCAWDCAALLRRCCGSVCCRCLVGHAPGYAALAGLLHGTVAGLLRVRSSKSAFVASVQLAGWTAYQLPLFSCVCLLALLHRKT